MTAVADTHPNYLGSLDGGLTESVVEALDEETLVSLLVARFRSFVARGDEAFDALRFAVGLGEAPNPRLAAGAFADARRFRETGRR
jgi:hypothetical protein